MPGQSYEHTTRQMTRGKEIAQASLQAPEGEQIGLKALATDLISEADAYLQADAHVAELERDLVKEAKESDLAIERLARSYDEFLPVAQHKAGFEGPAASQFATSDDFVAGAEQLEAAFEQHQGEAWADAARESLGGLIDETAKEYSEQVAMQRRLQKAEKRRAQAAADARVELVAFRKVVRATFGRTSKEYADLRDRRARPAKKQEPVG
jgi:hypothetical protein